MTIIDSKTKSGKAIKVAVFQAAELSDSIEDRAYEASEKAKAASCTNWRIMGTLPTGAEYIAQSGSVTAPVLTDEQAQRHSDGVDERKFY